MKADWGQWNNEQTRIGQVKRPVSGGIMRTSITAEYVAMREEEVVALRLRVKELEAQIKRIRKTKGAGRKGAGK